jgi:cyclophilin family peptidyl-prolyl cis-trans isomerase
MLTSTCSILALLTLSPNLPAEAETSTTLGTIAPITDKILMDVRISRQDGTFYVRDDLDDTPENKVFYGQLVLGLFGTVAPKTVQEFLSYIDVKFNPDDENPLPSYARSSFVSLDQSTGLLIGGNIPSLEVTEFGGSIALKYGGRILAAPLWIDGQQTERISHRTKGLLTHRNLDVAPLFGITTRDAAAELDGTHTVFGQLLLDDTSRAFLNVVQDIPTYATERPRSGDPNQETAMDTVTSAIFNSQREIFRSAAQTLGDSRVNKVYPGKLLRRVEVTQVRRA